jgi:cytochrome c heme-lyase
MGNSESVPALPKTPTMPESAVCPVKAKPENEAGCPVKYKNPTQYNVYSQKIDPLNQMPANPQQSAAPAQSQNLSVERVKSNIPKGGTDTDTW